VRDYAEFTCAGNPSEIVSWYFYNPSLTKLFSSPNSLFVDPKKYAVNTGAVAGTYTLVIYNLTLNDGGQYACDRQNEPAKFYASLVVVGMYVCRLLVLYGLFIVKSQNIKNNKKYRYLNKSKRYLFFTIHISYKNKNIFKYEKLGLKMGSKMLVKNVIFYFVITGCSTWVRGVHV